MSNDNIRQLKAVWDIVGEIQKHVTLTKKGQNYVGLCPFHNEKTPSFYVSPAKKIFHCFGCGENGDVISFMMKHESLSFKEVIIEKCNEYKIPHDFLSQAVGGHRDLDDLRAFLSEIQTRYSEWLLENKKAHQYCQSRDLSQSDIASFGLGFASSARDQVNWLNQKNNKDVALKSGLFNDEKYPLLSDRLIFPIHNPRGILVGFSGRVLDDTTSAKYINSPESMVFSKKKILYGLHHAKQTAKKMDRMIVVEGFMDVIAMHKAGFTETVAVMGTALTEFHAKEVRKYTKNIILMFDSDAAGEAAIKKSIPALQNEELTIHVAVLKAKDPGEFFKDNTNDVMEKIIANPIHYMDHYIQLVTTRVDISNASKKSDAVTQLSQMLSGEKNQIIKDHYKKSIAQTFDVSEHIIEGIMGKKGDKIQKSPPVSLKTDSKYKKSEDMVLYFLMTNIEFRQKHLSDVSDIIGWLKKTGIYEYFENMSLIDYELIEKISHSEIKGYLLSLCVKFTEFNFTYQLKEMEEILELLKQGKFNERIIEIKQMLGSKQIESSQEKDLLIELSKLIKKIK